MDEIKFKAYYMTRCTYWLISTWPVIWIVVFATLDIPREDRWILSTCLMGAGVYFCFYLNRFEPKFMKFGEDIIQIDYFNYKYFEIKDNYYPTNEIKALKDGDVLILSKGTKIVAKARKKALDIEDWEILESHFQIAGSDKPF